MGLAVGWRVEDRVVLVESSFANDQVTIRWVHFHSFGLGYHWLIVAQVD